MKTLDRNNLKIKKLLSYSLVNEYSNTLPNP